jgi:hypothetical protein
MAFVDKNPDCGSYEEVEAEEDWKNRVTTGLV